MAFFFLEIAAGIETGLLKNTYVRLSEVSDSAY